MSFEGPDAAPEEGAGEAPVVRGDCPSAIQRLRALKHRGCVTVACGRVPERGYQHLSRKHLGDPSLDRSRLFVSLGDVTVPDAWLPEGVRADDESVFIEEYALPDRSAAVQVPAAEADSPVVGRDVLDEIEAAVFDVGSRLDQPEGGRLRVFVHRFDALYDGCDATDLRGFLEALGTMMGRWHGMASVVLPVAPDSPHVRHLEDVDAVDILAQLRTRPDEFGYEHKLRLVDAEPTREIDWIGL